MGQSGIRTGILIACIFGITSAFSQTGGNISGNWKLELKDKPLEMEIYLAIDSAYYGKIINDNSSPSKNGTITLKKLKYNKTSQTFKGTMRPHDANVELDATVTVIDKDRLKIIAKKLFISRTVYLTRTK